MGLPIFGRAAPPPKRWDFMEAANSYAVENEGFMACNPFQAQGRKDGDDMEAGIDAGDIYI